MPAASVRHPRLIQRYREDLVVTRAELATGLQAETATLAPKYLYDALGARLFEAITELPEYYPTRTEAALLAAHGPALTACLPQGATLVDLGAGNCRKAAQLFGWVHPARYVAVDIAADFLAASLQALQQQFPDLEMLGVAQDFSSMLALPPEAGEGPRLLFYPGSSIGNFAPEQALQFLRQARLQAQGGGLLVGVDLLKPLSLLEPAYDDALGVTAAFNKNLLLHVNRLLGSNFEVHDWAHRAQFDTARSRIEMHLVARRDLTVRWPGAQRRFAAGEYIHTENAYKYAPQDFELLLREAGFSQVRRWEDERGWFAMFWAAG